MNAEESYGGQKETGEGWQASSKKEWREFRRRVGKGRGHRSSHIGERIRTQTGLSGFGPCGGLLRRDA